MAKCERCGKWGLVMRLDRNGLCEACQEQDARAAETVRKSMQQQIDELQAFHDEYVQIPDARAEAEHILSDAHKGAESALANAGKEAERMLADAAAKADQLLSDAQEHASKTVSLAQENADKLIGDAKAFELAAEARAAEIGKAAGETLDSAQKQLLEALETASKNFAASAEKLRGKIAE